MVLDSPLNIEGYVLNHLLEALHGLPRVRVSSTTMQKPSRGDQYQLDAEIRLDVAGRDLVLAIEIKKSVYPRDVRQILWQISKYARFKYPANLEPAAIPFLAAESISPGAKELLRKENVGYYDTGGSLFVPAHGAYIFIERPPPKTLEKSVRSLFKGKRAQVIHTLLINHGEWFGVKTLAELAQVAPSTVSETLIALERFDWLKTRGQGPSKERHLVEASALLDEWSKQFQTSHQRTERRYYVPRVEPDTLMKRIAAASDAHNVAYVITREAAAQRYAPFLSSISRVACRMPPGRATDKMLSELDARIVDEGVNLAVIETTSQGPFLFKDLVDGVYLASPVQVYLDLLRGEGRSREMADHLRHEKIGF
jgi:hypothetical protein